jgi:hypothetical protein
VRDSFETDDHVLADNTLLAEEKELYEGDRIYFFPELIVNGKIYRGNLEAYAVMTAICD